MFGKLYVLTSNQCWTQGNIIVKLVVASLWTEVVSWEWENCKFLEFISWMRISLQESQVQLST